jgi:hypothetical protein
MVVDPHNWRPRRAQEHRGRLRGPSDGLRAWADWILDLRARWHEVDHPPKPGWRLAVSLSGWLFVLVGIVEKITGG